MKIKYVKPKMRLGNLDHLKDTVLAQPTEVDIMRYDIIKKNDKERLIIRNSDVTLLFNQERIARELGSDNLAKFVDRLNASINEKGSKHTFTDDQLLKFVKSRHIQTMSELQAWSEYLTDNAQSLISDLKTNGQNKEISSEGDPGNSSTNSAGVSTGAD